MLCVAVLHYAAPMIIERQLFGPGPSNPYPEATAALVKVEPPHA